MTTPPDGPAGAGPWLPGRAPRLALPPQTVDVWRFRIDEPVVPERLGLLDAGERARADRFRFERDRQRFVAARAALRRVLERYTAHPAAALAFGYGPYGKPYLALPGAPGFNLSHSGDWGLCAVAPVAEVGVDVEAHRDVEVFDVARIVFSPDERAALADLPPDGHRAAFFTCWARKEAFIKAVGMGVSFGLTAFDVSLRPDEPATVLRVHDDATAGERWTLRALDVAPGYAAAVAVAGTGWDVRLFHFDQ